jgi:hypothetical protein
MPPTFSVTGLDGSTILIDATQIRMFRPAYGSEEPAGTKVIHFAEQRQFTPETGDQLAVRLQGIIASAQLTTPIGLPVWVDARKVSSVYPPTPDKHHSAVRAVLTVDDREQQLTEDVPTAGDILARAARIT